MKRVFSVWMAFILWLWASFCFGLTLKDDRGESVTLSRPAQRIVSLSPHLTELVFNISAGDKLVGVVNYSDYPAQAKKIPIVGDVNRLNLEAILRLQPDLILGWKTGNAAGDLARLQQLGLNVFVTEIEKLDHIPKMFQRLGYLTGKNKEAKEQTNIFNIQLKAILAQRTKKLPRRVFFEVWHQPLITLSHQHIISQIISVCGGSNIFNGAPTIAPIVSLESVLKRNPEVIFLSGSLAQNKQVIQFWRKNKNTEAGRKNQIYSLNPDTIERPTMRILVGMQSICETLGQVQ